MLREYWKNRLSPDAISLYSDMFKSISGLKEEIECGKFSPKEITEIYVALYNDHPELFHMAHNPQIIQSISMIGKTSTLRIKNIYDDNLIRQYQSALAKLRKDVISHIGMLISEQDKEKAVCDYIIERTAYEINNVYNQNAVAVLIEHKGQCSGIAKAVKLLLDWVGIESIVLNGDAQDLASGVEGPHSWNIVKVGGKCHHLDVTFMMGANTNKVKPFRYLYYNYSDEEIRRDHNWEYDVTPQCDLFLQAKEDTISDAVENRSHQVVISSLFELREELKKALNRGGHEITLISRIQVQDNKLLGYVQSCCKETINLLHETKTMSISIRGKEIKISW